MTIVLFKVGSQNRPAQLNRHGIFVSYKRNEIHNFFLSHTHTHPKLLTVRLVLRN